MPGRFTVRLTPSFQRDLERLPKQVQPKILKELERLEVRPYRVRYDVVGSEVVLYRVRDRKDIYRD
jgi:mRNA-degrading endonuclease RelE of RelBE toxin-antitoxin system